MKKLLTIPILLFTLIFSSTSYASNLANTTIPIKKLSNRLGHSDISTTMNVYSHAHVGDDSSYLEKANVRRA